MNKLLPAILLLSLTCLSCRKLDDYFQPPDTDKIIGTLTANLITGYCANVALSCMSENILPFTEFSRSNEGFPCTSLISFSMDDCEDFPYSGGIAETITIAGLWADENTGILTILFTKYNNGTSIFSLLEIETIPVVRHNDGSVLIALADMDIALNPGSGSLLDLSLSESEINYEYSRLEPGAASDVYVAISQRAYIIEISGNDTFQDISDDIYTISGGGQLAEIAGYDAGIFQQAMVDIEVSPYCLKNPLKGIALIQTVDAETGKFPGAGSALFQFNGACDGRARIIVATGIFLNLNGKSIDFSLN